MKEPDPRELELGAERAIRELARREPHALHRLAHLAVELLGELARSNPETLRPIAETSVAWPAFISRWNDFDNANAELLERLNVGTKALLRPPQRNGKGPKLRTPANALTSKLFMQLWQRRFAAQSFKRNGVPVNFQGKALTRSMLALKEPVAANRAKWFAALWAMVMEGTKGQPEKHPILRTLGQHRARHNETAVKDSRTVESDIRDGIRERLKGSFDTLFPQG